MVDKCWEIEGENEWISRSQLKGWKRRNMKNWLSLNSMLLLFLFLGRIPVCFKE
jgi:hypothetical protein